MDSVSGFEVSQFLILAKTGMSGMDVGVVARARTLSILVFTSSGGIAQLTARWPMHP